MTLRPPLIAAEYIPDIIEVLSTCTAVVYYDVTTMRACKRISVISYQVPPASQRFLSMMLHCSKRHRASCYLLSVTPLNQWLFDGVRFLFVTAGLFNVIVDTEIRLHHT